MYYGFNVLKVIQGCVAHLKKVLTSVCLVFSVPRGHSQSFQEVWGGVPAVCFSVDEQSVDERAATSLHNTSVGHLPGTASSNLYNKINPVERKHELQPKKTTITLTLQQICFIFVAAILFRFPQAEAEGFSHFHLYVCAAFLIEWRKEILSMIDFQVLISL